MSKYCSRHDEHVTHGHGCRFCAVEKREADYSRLIAKEQDMVAVERALENEIAGRLFDRGTEKTIAAAKETAINKARQQLKDERGVKAAAADDPIK